MSTTTIEDTFSIETQTSLEPTTITDTFDLPSTTSLEPTTITDTFGPPTTTIEDTFSIETQTSLSSTATGLGNGTFPGGSTGLPTPTTHTLLPSSSPTIAPNGAGQLGTSSGLLLCMILAWMGILSFRR